MSKKALRLGIAGLGTVGGGVLTLLREHAMQLTSRAGRPFEVTAVSARSRYAERDAMINGVRWYEDALALADDPNVDVVIELIGGSEGIARSLVETALINGRDVVTANKALMAVHGARLARLAEKNHVRLRFEAAVAGGVPAIKLVREGLAADRLKKVGGILNGTCNYILSTMWETGKDFQDVLQEAQALGYAESDPSTDIDGVDGAHKLAILAGLAFGRPVTFSSLFVEGIRAISAADHAFARDFGYRIKLLGIAKQHDNGAIEAWMRPCMVPHQAPIARVNGVFNAVMTEGLCAGPMLIEGRGAGAGPTAVAVVSDLLDLARGSTLSVWGSATDDEVACLPRSSFMGRYFLRLFVADQAGVMADITAALRDTGVSLGAMSQHSADAYPGGWVPLALVTHETRESAMLAALDRLAHIDTIREAPLLMKIETV